MHSEIKGILFCSICGLFVGSIFYLAQESDKKALECEPHKTTVMIDRYKPVQVRTSDIVGVDVIKIKGDLIICDGDTIETFELEGE